MLDLHNLLTMSVTVIIVIISIFVAQLHFAFLLDRYLVTIIGGHSR